MTIAVVILSIALAGSIGGLVGLGVWMIKRDDKQKARISALDELLAKSQMAREEAEKLAALLKNEHDSDRNRYQARLAEHEKQLVEFRAQVVSNAKSPELRAMLLKVLDKKAQ